MQVATSVLRQRQTAVRYNWGFRFALWCAILWAVGYQGIDLLVHNDALLGMTFAGANPLLVGLAIAVVFTVLLTAVSLVWVAANRGIHDWLRTVVQFNTANLLLFASAAVGGLVALISYVVTFQANSGFAVAMVMFYSSIGTAMAHLWYKEKVSRRGIIGLAIIALGCLLLYLSESGASGGDWLVVLGMGIFAGLGWGVEGALANRAMDVVDSNVAMSIRFTYEAVIWLAVFVISLAMGQGGELTEAAGALIATPPAFFMLLLAAFAIHFDYLCWYKSFVYCGVSRGLAVSTVSSALTALIGLALLTIMPSYLAVFAFALMAIGIFLVFSGQDNRNASLREVALEPSSRMFLGVCRADRLALKARVLVAIAERGRCWDYELATLFGGNQATRRGRFFLNKIRLYLVEAQAAGYLVALDEQAGNSTRSTQGKVHGNYALTEYGAKRLVALHLVEAEEGNRSTRGADN